MTTGRRARVNLVYEGQDITADLEPDLLAFTWTDNLHGKADDLAITVQDRDSKWSADWLPGLSDTVEAVLAVLDWDAPGAPERSVYCGRFSVDRLTFAGRRERAGVVAPGPAS